MVIGGLGRHVHHLATELGAAGHDVVVLSRAAHRHRPAQPPDHRRGQRGRARRRGRAGPARVQLRHRHDGLDAGDGPCDDARRVVAARTGGPTWCTRTIGWWPTPPSRWPNSSMCHWFPPFTPPRPAGTPGWVSGRVSRQVHALESWLVHESDSLITCSASMREEITALFGPGLSEVTVIPNGIDTAGWPFAKRRGHAGPAELLYFGRLEYEKGVHDAIAALPRIRRTHPGTTLTVAGDGTQLDFLAEQARKHKVLKAVEFRWPRGSSTAAAPPPSSRCRGAAVALRAVRHRRAGSRRGRRTAGDLECGGLGEAVIDGVTGLSYPPRDIAGLAAAVRTAARRSRRGATSRPGGPGAADVRLLLADRGRGDRCGVPGRQTR